MPVDFDDLDGRGGPDDLGQRLDALDGDLGGVRWVGSGDLRRRGQQRVRHQAVAGTLAVCLGVGGLGLSITGNLPGQQQHLADRLPLAGVPEADRTPSPTDANGVPVDQDSAAPDDDPATGSTGGNTTTPDDGVQGGDGSDTDRDGDEHEATPSDPASPTEPGDDPPTPGDPTPTEPDPGDEDGTPTPTPTETGPPPLEAGALPDASEMPALDTGAWVVAGSGTGEGSGASRAVCSNSGLSADNPMELRWRDFATDAGSQSVTGYSVAGSFETAAEAEAAYLGFRNRVQDCGWGTQVATSSVSLNDGTARWWVVERAGEPDPEGEGDPVPAERHVVGLVQRGAATAYVTWHDTDPAEQAANGEAMADTLRAVATRLEPFAG